MTTNPYKILIAEILLHRTKAEQVVGVYEKFISEFPTITSLSKSPSQRVSSIVWGLGLHWRTKMLREMAMEIVAQHDGKIPQDKNKLTALPGVSDYIASALRCFAFDKADPLLDTNTTRIVGRLFGVKVTDSSRRNRQFAELYASLTSNGSPREFGFAMMDFGALICLPKEPKCTVCPVNKFCLFGLSKLGEERERKACCRTC